MFKIFTSCHLSLVLLVITQVISAITGLKAQDDRSNLQSVQERTSLQLIEAAPYIVEAFVSCYSYFYGTDNKTIYTELALEILADYKGNLTYDTILLVVPGGIIGTDDQFYEDTGIPAIHKGKKYVLLLKPNKFKILGKIESTLPAFNLTVENSSVSVARYTTRHSDRSKIIAFDQLEFQSLEHLNSFIFGIVDKSFYKKK